MSFFGLGSKSKVPTIPPPFPSPIPKGLMYGAAQLLATPKTSWENDYVKFGTYEEGTRMLDSKLFIAQSNIRQFLYNRHPFDRDLRGTNFTNAFINIDINKQTQHTYLSPAHDSFIHQDEYMPKVAFYLAPPMDKAGLPPMVKTSKHYVELLKSHFASPSTPTRGWSITTSYDREVTSKSYLPTMNVSLVQIKDFIAEIHVFKETKNQSASVRNNTPNLVETHRQYLLVVALWLDSRKSKTDEIQFFDVHLYEPPLSEAFQHARINKLPNTVNSKVRIDVSIQTLRAFYEESKVLNPEIQGDFSPTDNRIMQTGFIRAFGGLSDAASINSSNAFYPLGGIRNFRCPLEGFVRYDSDLPPPFDTYLRNAVVNSPAFAKEDIFIMRIEDLQSLQTFQVVPSRDCKSRNPDDKAGDIWSITRRNYAAHPRYCMYEGALIKTSTSLLVTLDYSAVPCKPQKTPLQSLATTLFRDDGFLLFKGPAGAMVPFWDEKPQAASLASTVLPQDKWPLPKDQVRMPSDPCLVEVAAPRTESLHSVKIVMGLLGPFLSIDQIVQRCHSIPTEISKEGLGSTGTWLQLPGNICTLPRTGPCLSGKNPQTTH